MNDPVTLNTPIRGTEALATVAQYCAKLALGEVPGRYPNWEDALREVVGDIVFLQERGAALLAPDIDAWVGARMDSAEKHIKRLDGGGSWTFDPVTRLQRDIARYQGFKTRLATYRQQLSFETRPSSG